ncbi:hypothetical protein [Bosea caraganae]|nr:hypothetical protein [Bosea caraganae]
MVADELALDLARRHVSIGAKVLDPFCGSGRLLAAADHAAVRAGIDTNPLAWLLTSTKLSNASATVVRDLAGRLQQAQKTVAAGASFKHLEDRQVDWFSPSVIFELGRIVGWINSLGLGESERWIIASALSATVREVSFARQSGWKLHRRAASEREALSVCPWQRLQRRLSYCATELRRVGEISGERLVALGPISALNDLQHPVRSQGPYDVVLTSPPYGDSRTTVQYGAASALCLAVVCAIDGLGHLVKTGGEIDAQCLGGAVSIEPPRSIEIRKYWAGAGDSKLARGVTRFLSDYEAACETIAANVRPGGTAVLVVGRRSTGGYRVKLDEFTVDCLGKFGFGLESRQARDLQQKRVPRTINRFGRSVSPEIRERGKVVTMASEIILVLRRQNLDATQLRPISG